MLLKIPIWYFIIFFTLAVLLCGITTEPRFNDGIFHLSVARHWFDSGCRPISIKNTIGISPVGESPLWYWIVQFSCHIYGKFHYYAAQTIQSICYFGILWLTYLLARHHTQNITKAKIAVIIVASAPIMSVPTVLCYVDILCCLFAVLAYYLLSKKKFYLAIFAAAGIWYSKRTGTLILIPLLSSWALIVYIENQKKLLNTAFTWLYGGGLFIALMAWDIYFRLTKLNISSDFLMYLDKNKHARVIYHSPAATSIQIPDWLQWLGIPALILLIFFTIILLQKKSRFLQKNIPYLYLLIIFTILFFIMAPAYTLRYYGIIFPLVIIMVISQLKIKRPIKRIFFLIIIAGAFLQFLLTIMYIYRTRQTGPDSQEVFNTLKEVSGNKSIIWYEKEYGTHYLQRTIYWNKYLPKLLDNSLNPAKDNIGALVITKRYIYKYKGTYYDRGLPCKVIENLSNNQLLSKVVDNNSYQVYIPLHNKKNSTEEYQ